MIPNDIVQKHGPKWMLNLIKSAINLSDVIWQSLIADYVYSTPENHAALEKKCFDLISRIQDNSVRIAYNKFIRNKLWEKYGKYNTYRRANKVVVPSLNELDDYEKILIYIIIKYPSLLCDPEIEERFAMMVFKIKDWIR